MMNDIYYDEMEKEKYDYSGSDRINFIISEGKMKTMIMIHIWLLVWSLF